jgi:hypothetical protein
MRPNFKDVPVADAMYRIGRLTAADGSWISVMLTEKLRGAREAEAKSMLATPTTATRVEAPPAATEEPAGSAAPVIPQMTIDEGMMMTASFLVTKLNRAELADVQMMCVQACSKMEPVGDTMQPMPLIVNGNQWVDPEMEYDGPTVLQLTKEVLAFNIVRFFHAAG